MISETELRPALSTTPKRAGLWISEVDQFVQDVI